MCARARMSALNNKTKHIYFFFYEFLLVAVVFPGDNVSARPGLIGIRRLRLCTWVIAVYHIEVKACELRHRKRIPDSPLAANRLKLGKGSASF